MKRPRKVLLGISWCLGMYELNSAGVWFLDEVIENRHAWFVCWKLTFG